MKLIKLTDEDGDPIYVPNDIIAIYTKSETTTVASFLDRDLVSIKANPPRGIISKSTGQWAVRESYEEILAKIDVATEAEELAKCGSSE